MTQPGIPEKKTRVLLSGCNSWCHYRYKGRASD